MRIRSLIAGLFLLFAIACKGGSDNPPPPPPPDFTLSVTPPANIQAGASGSAAITLSRSGGHSAAVSLSVASNTAGITGSGSVATGSTSGSLALSVPVSVAAGSYGLSVTATDGSLTKSVSITLAVTPAPDFSLSVAAPGAIQAGSAGATTVTATRSGGHSAAITLSLAGNAQGITGSGSLAAGASSGNLALNVPLAVAAGTYTLSANGSDGSLSRSATFSLTVTPAPDFAVAVTPPASIVAGGSGSGTVAVTRSGGHSAALTLSLAANAQGITGSGSVAAGASGGALSLSVPLSVPAGTYSLSANATDGSLTHGAAFSLVVTPAPDFSLSAANPGNITAGSSGTTSVTAARVGGHSAAITLSLAANAQNITATGSIPAGGGTGTLTLQVPSAAAAGTYALTVNGTDGTRTRSAAISLTVLAAPAQNFSLSVTPPAPLNAGSTGSASVAAARTGGHTAAIALSINANPQGITGSGTISFGASAGTVNITVPASVPGGTYTLTVTGNDGTLSRSASFSVTVNTPDFSLSVAPPAAISAGSSGNTTVSVTRSFGHSAAITLVLASNAQGVTGSGTIGGGASSGTLTLTVPGGATPGTYSYTCNGSDGTLTRSATFSLTIQPPGAVTYSFPAVYITQATQTPAFDVPLVKDRDGYLRAFLVASGANSATPTVTVEIRNASSAVVFSSTIPAPAASVPTAVDESNLAKSWNVAVPAAYIQPGYTLKATASIGGAVWPSGGTPQALNVKIVNPLRVTFWAVHTTDGRTGGGGTLGSTYTSVPALLEKVWPVNNSPDYTYGGVFNSTVNNLGACDGSGDQYTPWNNCLSELWASRPGGSNRYYYGVVNPCYGGGIAGLGGVSWPCAIGWDKTNPGYGDSGIMSGVYAHEVGHNFGLGHAPCNVTPEPGYPYAGGFIGTWGIDVSTASLKNPATYHDVMGYCSTIWSSDYNFNRVLTNRTTGGLLSPAPEDPEGQSSTEGRTLLLWGQITDGKPVLQPAFHLAMSSENHEPGPHTLEGFDAWGKRLFSTSFSLLEVADLPEGHSGGHFSLRIPLTREEANRLTELRWTKAGEVLATQSRSEAARVAGPSMEPLMQPEFDGRTRLLWDGAIEPMVMLRDRATGLCVGFARGGEAFILTDAEELELVLSDGLRSRSVVQKRPRFER